MQAAAAPRTLAILDPSEPISGTQLLTSPISQRLATDTDSSVTLNRLRDATVEERVDLLSLIHI